MIAPEEAALPPVFVCGQGRSGTTWIAIALGQSDELEFIGEAWLINRLGDLARWDETIFHEWGDFTVWRRMNFAPDRFRACLGEFYLNTLLAAAGGRRFVEKTPGWNLDRLDLLTEILPDARYVLIYRDGRNQVASMEAFRNLNGFAFDFAEACRAWSRAMGIIKRYRDAPPRGNIHIVRYEDLIDDFATHFATLCIFTQIAQFRPAPFAPNSAFSSISGDDGFNRRWHDWTPHRKEIFRQAAGQQLIDWGYADSIEDW